MYSKHMAVIVINNRKVRMSFRSSLMVWIISSGQTIATENTTGFPPKGSVLEEKWDPLFHLPR